MRYFLLKIKRLFLGIPGWLVSIIILLAMIGLLVWTWLYVWYLAGSKLAIVSPGPATIYVTGYVRIIDKPWPFTSGKYRSKIYLPYEKQLTCESACEIIDIPAGSYEIIASNIPNHAPWSGSILVERDTYGTFEIPAEPLVRLKVYVLPDEIKKQHLKDLSSFRQLFPNADTNRINDLDRLAVLYDQNRGFEIYDMSTKTRHTLIGAFEPQLAKWDGDNMIIIEPDRIISYNLSTNESQELIGMRDRIGPYTLSNTGQLTRDGLPILFDPTIQNIFLLEQELVIQNKDGQFVIEDD